MELPHPKFVKYVVEILLQGRRKLDIRAKPSMRNVLYVMNANNLLVLSSLSEERTSACVESAMRLVMPG